MEQNSEESLKLEGAISRMDFEHSEDSVQHQPNITLDVSSNEGHIPIQFEHIQDKSAPLLMDTGNEEIIVSDFMGDQYTLQEYSIRDNQTSEATTTEESNIQNILQNQSDTMVDLQFDPQTMTQISVAQEAQAHPKYITVKVAGSNPASTSKKGEQAVMGRAVYRQVAIAPKPPELVQTTTPKFRSTPTGYSPTKQYAIAPKPVALVANRTNLPKKLTASGKHVFAQIGKQFIMVPTSGNQKIKLIQTSDSSVQCVNTETMTSLTSGKNITGTAAKPLMAKVVMQGNQQAVITKMLPTASALSPRARYVMQQKTIPISIGSNKVVLTSPKPGKKQIYTIKSAPSTTSQQQGTTTKKVVITANPTQKVILKAASAPKTAQVIKDGKVILQGQRSQLHKIDVPGNGVQVIRLITNQTSGPSKVTPKQTPALTVPAQTYVLTDKGNLIPMPAEKIVNGQPPPLVSTGHSAVAAKPAQLKLQQKLVRIAPATAAPTPATTGHKIPQTTQHPRSGQSLLTPQPTVESSVSLEGLSGMLQPRSVRSFKEEVEDLGSPTSVEESAELETEEHEVHEAVDSKMALQALIADAVGTDDNNHDVTEVEVEFERQQSPSLDENTSSIDHHDSSARSDEHPLIVIPSSYPNHDDLPDEDSFQGDQTMGNSMLRVDAEDLNSFQPPRTPPLFQSDSEIMSNELTLRPRKACNCTKSQCLKLYCDCFANGEFCNRCNCNNCHNNLENEELRQKAIRACLDRNPNAFRPKIGKSKTGGPEIIRRHNKGCNCKRSGCLKNYCECYEAKIACTSMCKCVGCRNVEETLGRARRRDALVPRAAPQGPDVIALKQPCSFMTGEVIEAVCQCLVAAAAEPAARAAELDAADAVRDVIDEFARCLQDIISASHHTAPALADQAQA